MPKLDKVLVDIRGSRAVGITVGGVDYLLTDDDARVGDIIRMDVAEDEYDEITAGGYYEVVRVDRHDDARIIDDEGDEFDTCGDDFAVFRKSPHYKAPVPAESPKAGDDLPSKLPSDYVIHDGKVYRKEARVAKVGDLAIRTCDFISIPAGSIVEAVSMGGFAPIASDGHSLFSGEHAVLVPTDTVTLGGREYALEKRKAAEGERVVLVEKRGQYAEGSVLNVAESDAWGDGKAVRLVSRMPTFHSRYLVLVPKAQAQPIAKSAATPSVQYREVKRKARVGERIRIVKATASNGTYRNGDEFTAIKVNFDGTVTTDATPGYTVTAVWEREYVVLEPVAEEPRRLTVGDYVRVTKLGGGHDYSIGDIVKITYFPGDFFKGEVLSTGRTGNWLAEEQVVRATDEEVAAAKAEIERKKDTRNLFAKGDKVRLISGGDSYPLYGFSNGEVYEVSDPLTTRHEGKRVAIRNESGGTGFALPEQIEKVVELAPQPKYKSGDKVRVTYNSGTYTLTQRRPDLDGDRYGIAWNIAGGSWIGEKQIVGLAEEPKKPWEPAVGDYVKVLRNTNGHNYEIGSIVKVSTTPRGKNRYFEAVRSNGTSGNWLRTSDVEPASESDFTAQKESAKWAKIGRKVGEYKAGDIVRVIRPAGGIRNGHPEGTIGEVAEDTVVIDLTHGNPLVDGLYCNAVIVVPVEQRFDKLA